MKQFKQLVQELPAKKVVFTFGRFQPPTIGHGLLVAAVKHIADKQDADHIIYASKTEDKKSNPLPVNRKVYYLKRMFPGANFQAASADVPTFIHAVKQLNKKYKNIVMVAGSDRVAEYQKLLNKYNGKDFHYDSIEVVSAGERDPDAEGASGMSGTKMREAAKKGDFNLFKKGLPKTLSTIDGKRLMNEIREGMGLEQLKEKVELPKDDIREAYHRGDIYNVGDVVECNGQVYVIEKRGSNHLLLREQSGALVNKWLQDVQQSDKEFVLEGTLQEMKYTSADKIKVARVIAGALGVEDTDKSSNPELLINNGLRKVRSKPMRPEYIDVLHNMLQTAREAGIKFDEKLVPQKAQKVEESTMAFASLLKKNKDEFENDTKDAESKAKQFRTSEKKKSQDRDAAWWKAQDDAHKAGKSTFEFDGKTHKLKEGTKQPNGTDKVGDASAVLSELSPDTLKSYTAKALGSKSAADFTRGVKMAQGSGGEDELRKKSEKRSAGIHTAIKKLTREELEEATSNNQVKHIYGGSKDKKIGEVGKDRDGNWYAKHQHSNFAASGFKSRKEAENAIHAQHYATVNEEIELEEARLGDVSNKGREIQHITPDPYRPGKWKRGVISKARGELPGSQEYNAGVVKKHVRAWANDQLSTPKLKKLLNPSLLDKLKSKVFDEDIELEEGKIGDLHAEIGRHLDKHISDFKSGHTGMDQFGKKVMDAHKKVAQSTGLEHKHAVKHVNDYVDSKLNEETLHERTIKPEVVAQIFKGVDKAYPKQDYRKAHDEISAMAAKLKADKEKKAQDYYNRNEEVETISDLLEQIATAAMMGKDTQHLKKQLRIARGMKQPVNTSDVEAEEEPCASAETAIGHSMTAPHETDNIRKQKVRYATEAVTTAGEMIGEKSKKSKADLDEDQATAEYKVKTYYDNALGKTVTRKVRPHRVTFAASKKNAEPEVDQPGEAIKNEEFPGTDMSVVAKKDKKVNEGIVGMPAGDMGSMPIGQPEPFVGDPAIISPDLKKKLKDKKALNLKENEDEEDHEEDHEDEHDDLSTESDLDDMASEVQDLDDIIDAYDEDELVLVDDEGKEVEEDEDEKEVNEEALNEVLSRMERMKAKIRFAQSKSKRERRIKIAIKTPSSMKTLNNRARKLAVKIMKQRLARKPLNKLSVSEKERIEKVVQKRKKIIDRLAMKLVSRVKKIEQTRLHRGK